MFVVLWFIAITLLLPWGSTDVWAWLRVLAGAIFAAMAGVFNYLDLEEAYGGRAKSDK